MVGGKRGLTVGVLLLGWWARLPALFANTFAADEALFATFARLIAVWREPLLQGQVVDKPPLLFYVQALFYPLFGPVEWAARLPNLAGSMVVVALTAVLARRLFHSMQTAVFAAALMAFSPLTVQFSATAYTDPLLVALLLAAAVTCHLPVWCGLWFGLALATKYQAVLFLPLLFLLIWPRRWGQVQWGQWLAGVGGVMAILLAWDVARTGTWSLWAAQMESYGGLRLAWSWELWPRLQAWLTWIWLAWGGWFAGVWGLLITLALWRPVPAARVLALFALFYVGVHWLVAVPVWDRYLLPLMPVLVLLAADGLAALSNRIEGSAPYSWQVAGLIVLLLPGLWLARNGRYPMGGQPLADSGAAKIAQVLYDAEYGTVLYDHWYSWQWRYHLFDRRVYISWLPHPAALTAELAVFGQDGAPRYLALPADERARPMETAVTNAGFSLEDVAPGVSADIHLYKIVPQEQP